MDFLFVLAHLIGLHYNQTVVHLRDILRNFIDVYGQLTLCQPCGLHILVRS